MRLILAIGLDIAKVGRPEPRTSVRKIRHGARTPPQDKRYEVLGKTARAKSCKGMIGLVEEG